MYDLKCLLVLEWKKKHTIHVTTLEESFLLANECQIYVSKVLSILPLGNFPGEVDQWDSRLTLLTWTLKDSHGCCINCNFCQYFTWKEKVVLLCLYILSNISNSHLWKTYGKTDSYTDRQSSIQTWVSSSPNVFSFSHSNRSYLLHQEIDACFGSAPIVYSRDKLRLLLTFF